MCGRFTLRSAPEVIAEVFGLATPPPLQPRFNIAPSQSVAVVRERPDHQRELVHLRWGLIPFWADDPAIGHRTANARCETAASKPAFRRAFRFRRCLVVADGFFEWQRTDGKKQPYFIQMKDHRPFGMAGLWERWNKHGDPIESCTILTTDANDLMLPIHERMPVIIPPGEFNLWLDPEVHGESTLSELLRPFDSQAMMAYPISTTVNHWKNDVAACIEPLRSE